MMYTASSQAVEMEQIITALNGEIFTVSPQIWQQNQQKRELLLRFLAVPLQSDEQTLWLAVDSLNNINAIETFSFLYGKKIEPVLLADSELKVLLQSLNPQTSMQIEEPHLLYTPSTENQPSVQPKSDEPTIRLLDQIFENALQHNASDIHLEPQDEHLRVRFRIDGVLHTQSSIPISLAARIISRLKILAKLDISETRIPQDGRFQFKTTFSDYLDFRLSTLPLAQGEKAVLRLQKNRPITAGFTELGMNERQTQMLQHALKQPQGLILVTGPTGSGKSITLYTALEWLNDPSKHILTVEDPIEIALNGILQTQTTPSIGLTFSKLLRTFLRQDPDIIMLGEIRDRESAEIAMRAAQTGHLVLSTLHTNDAPSAISRLLQLGIQQYEIENTLLLVIAQRLLRKCCHKCGTNLAENTPCLCRNGYMGRVGVYQFLSYEHTQGHTRHHLDYDTLWAAAQEKIASRITDLAEAQRVLGEHNA